MSNIQVGIKMRPLLPKEMKEKDAQILWRVTENSLSLAEQTFHFDHVFDEKIRNEFIFEKMAKHIVESAVGGFNGTIFAYGQTSSGKTYTMMGDEKDPGVMVLAAKEIFEIIEKASDTRQFLLRVGFIEIYNEKINDLLNKSSQDLKLHEDGNGNVIVNCHEICVTSEDQLLSILEKGNKERTVGGTLMNERSSRSHSILRLTIESRDVSINKDGRVTQGLLHLVDLAGSERADQTGARGVRLVESGNINKSLLFLSQVIKRLSENSDAGFINYRDSKLTRILQASLGGNAFTSIICTVKPNAADETLSTLNFATRAKTIKNKPHVTEILTDAAAMKRLERELKEIRRQFEQERAASQMKLSQMESLLRVKQHHIINSSSLHRLRKSKNDRRRTWCPDMTVSGLFSPNALSTSHLKPPSIFMTPQITMRDNVVDFPPPSSMDQLSEEFESAEQFNFNIPLAPTTPPNKMIVHNDSTSPVTPNKSAHIRMIENELRQLEEFTNLENKVGVDHDIYKSLKESIDSVCRRNCELEREHMDYLLLKDELEVMKCDFAKAGERCDELQVAVSKLNVTKKETDEKIEEYVSKISQLQKTIESLELENRSAVDLQFLFDRHQTKSKLRETELLQVLKDKEDELAKIEKQFKLLQAEKTAELMQLSHCVVGNGSDANEGNPQNALAPLKSVCNKCEDLQRELEENKNVTNEFQKLTLQYRELQLSYEESVNQVKSTQKQLAELENNVSQQLSVKECDELRQTIVELRQKLETVKAAYDEVQLERDGKTERCAALQHELELAQQKYAGLETKYANLESTWHRQEGELSSIRADFASLESKYNELQVAYDHLKACETKCAHDCQRLQRENDELQKEIQKLKARIEQMQQELSDGLVAMRDIKTIEVTEHAKRECEGEKIFELQIACDKFQKENEQLSMDILDRIEENEILMKKYKNLEAEMEKLQIEFLALEQTREEVPNRLTTRENDATFMETCADLETKLAEAETQQKQWLSEKAAFQSQIEALQTTVDDLRSVNKSLQTKNESLIETTEQTVRTLREEVLRLSKELLEKSTILESCLETCACVENSQRIDRSNLTQFNELLQERIMSSELEWSSIINETNVTRFEMHESEIKLEHIEPLPKPWTVGAETTMESEATKSHIKIEKLNSPTESNCSGDATSIYRRRFSLGNRTLCAQEAESATLSQSASSGENDTQSSQLIKTLQAELKRKEEQCAQLQLELLEKINQAENGFRENLRLYNKEWEHGRQQYESKINELEQALAQQSEAKEATQNPNDISLSASFMADQQYKDHQRHKRQSDCSTPTSPTSSPLNLSTASLIEKRKIRAERSQVIAECNEKMTELSEKVERLTAANLELSNALSEKARQLEEQEQIIETATTSLEARYETALMRAMTDREIFKLETIIDYQTEHLRNMKIQNLNKLSNHLRETGNKLKAQLHIKNCANQIEVEIFALLATIEANTKKRNSHIQKLEKIDENLLNERNLIQVDAELLAKLDAKFEPTSKEIFQLKRHVENLSLEIDGKISKLEDLCESLKTEQAEVQLKSKIAEKEETISQLETTIKEHIIEKNLKTAQLEMMKQQREAEHVPKEEFSKLGNEIETLKRQLNEYESTVGVLKKQATELENTKRYSETKLDELKTENECLQKQLEEAIDKSQLLTQDLKEIEQQKAIIGKQNESLTSALKVIQARNENLQVNLSDLSKTHEAATSALEAEKQKLETELAASKDACAKAVEELETCKLKSETNAQELHTLKLQAQNIMKTISDYEVLEKELEAVNKSKENLNNELNKLLGEAKADNAKLESLNDELKVHLTKEQVMQRELNDLQVKLEVEQQKYEREAQELRSQVHEFELKCQTLKTKNVELEKNCSELRQKLDNLTAAHNVQQQQSDQVEALKAENVSLTTRLKALESETMAKSTEYEQELKQRLETYNKMSELLATKSKDFKEKLTKIETTNTCLVDQNKQLSERIEVLNEIIQSQTATIASLTADSANNSLELGGTSNYARRSPVGKSLTANGEKERKNRRLSQHDENRRQSAKFTPIANDVGTMTLPIGEICECNELRQKLAEKEKELYIKKSQITAYSLELRNNPLKLENEKLIKRIQEEQQKYRVMATKYKDKVEQQISKIRALENEAIAAASKPATTECGTLTTLPHNKDNETQTEYELDGAFHRLEAKYRDLKKICRSRANEIRKYTDECDQLKQKLSEKENLYNGNLKCTSSTIQVNGGGSGSGNSGVGGNTTTQQSMLTESSIPNMVFGRLHGAKKKDPK